MDNDQPSEWEELPTRSAGNTVLTILLGVVATALIGSLVANPTTVDVLDEQEPSPEGLTIQSMLPTPQPTVQTQTLTFLGQALSVADAPPHPDVAYGAVTVNDGEVGVPVEGQPTTPFNVSFSCDQRNVVISAGTIQPLADQVVLAAVERYTVEQQCRATAGWAPRYPDPGPVPASWAVPLLGMLDRAGFTADVRSSPERLVTQLTPPGLPAFQAVIGGRSENHLLPSKSAIMIGIAEGRAALDGDDVYLQCHKDSVMRVAADTPDLLQALALMDCRPFAPPMPGGNSSVILTEVNALRQRVASEGLIITDQDVTDSVVRFFVDGPQGRVRLLVTPNVAPWGRQDKIIDLADGQALQRSDGRLSLHCRHLTLTSDPEARTITTSALEALVTADDCTPQPPGGPRLGYELVNGMPLAERYVEDLQPYMNVLRTLQDSDVRFVVVGAVAAALEGDTRPPTTATLAVDLAPDNMRTALRLLQDLGLEPHPPVPVDQFADPQTRRRWVTAWQLSALRLSDPIDPRRQVDVLLQLPVPSTELFADAEAKDLGDIEVLVAAPHHLAQIRQDVDGWQHPMDVAGSASTAG